MLLSPGLATYMTLSRFTLDAGHFPVAVAVLLLGLLSSTSHRSSSILRWAGLLSVAFTVVSGALMLLKVEVLEPLVRFAGTSFDLGLVASLVTSGAQLVARLLGHGGAAWP